MAKSITSLSGSAKDDYLGRVLGEEAGLDPAARRDLAERLQREVTRVWVKAPAVADEAVAQGAAEPEIAGEAAATDAAAETAGFNPYAPNVVVVIRRSGREGALEALNAIERPEHLRLLAREQQLVVDAALVEPAAIRAAIVAAAERRIANRRAAAS